MTEKELEQLGFHRQGSYINQIYGEFDKMDLGWFGVRVDDLKTLTPAELVRKVYEIGMTNGRKDGANSIRQSIHELLKIDE